MTLEAPLAAAVALGAFAALSFYDGIVVHFFLERLPARPASRLEHLLHTGRALLFPAILVTFFAGRGHVAIGWSMLAIDQALEIWDMAVERRSRDHTGGLPSTEYVVHGILTTLRAIAVTFTATIDRHGTNTTALDGLVSLLLPGSLIASAAHVFLATHLGRVWIAPRRGAT